MMKKILNLLLVIFFIIKIQAQGLIPKGIKSPNVATMEKFGDIPVNLFTGTPNISIPLYEILDGVSNIPIELRYHSSLVKPNQPPGWVGLGWGLDCGGAITRQVRGAYDEFYYDSGVLSLYKNYLNVGSTNLETDSNWLSISRMYNTYYDYNNLYGDQQSDEFYFNFLGHSGKFFYGGPNKGWVVVSNEKIKIEVNGYLTPTEIFLNALFKYVTYEPQWYYNSRVNYLKNNQTNFIKEFTLITSNGNRYTFGGIDAIELTTDFTTPEDKNQDTPYSNINLSSWLLKKIVDTNGKTISYDYKRDYPNLSMSHYCSAYSNNVSDQSSSWQYCLSGICLDNFGNFKFDLSGIFGGSGIQGSSYSSASQLINPYRLNGKFIFPLYLDKITTENEELSFETSPATTLDFNDSQWIGGNHRWDHSGEYEIWRNNIKWKKLNSIEIKDRSSSNVVKKITLDYNENINQRFSLKKVNILGSDLINYKKYEFEYNDIAALPLYGGNYTDHWGCFNGINIRASLETAYEDRQTNPGSVLKGLLTQIKYPTGGTTSFVWEAHKYSKVLSDKKDALILSSNYAGGSRIKEIKNYDDYGVLKENKKFLYVSGYDNTLNPNSLNSSGVLNGLPRYTFKFENYPGQINGITNFSFRIFSLNSFTNNNPTGNGSHIGYDEVVEVNLDNSYTKHFFTNYGADINGVSHFDEIPLAFTGWKIGEQSVYMPYTSLEEERGKEIATYDYNSSNILVKKKNVVFRYDIGRFTNYTKQKIISNAYGSNTSGDALMFGVAIKNYSYYYYPINETTVIYDTYGLNPVSTSKYFSYNNENQVIEEKILNSLNEQKINKFLFPQNFISDPLMQNLVDINKINYPIETESYLFLNLLNKQKTTYAKDATTNNFLLPKSVYAAKFPNNLPNIFNIGNLEKKITYDFYDSKGNITQYTPESGMPVTIIWGYNKTQPIAKIENATNAQVATALGVANISSLTEANLPAIDALRNSSNTAIQKAMITTYTHKPLIGVSTITDPKGDVMRYNYDTLGRLKNVLDKNGNVLTENQYHYKN